MKLSSRTFRAEDPDLYWTIVAATLRVVFEEHDAAIVDSYRAFTERPISAYPLLIYHRSPFEIATMLRRHRGDITDEHFEAFEAIVDQLAPRRP
jgi:hypothetical protein